MTISVRNMTSADIPLVAKLHVDSWRKHYAGILPADFLNDISVDESERRWRQRLADETRDTFERVVLHNDTVVGFAMGQPARDEAICPELRSFYTDTTFRFALLPFNFMRHMIEDLAATGPSQPIQLWVLRDNARGRAFFHATGYEQDGVSRNARFGQAEAVLLRYALTPDRAARLLFRGRDRP